MTPLTAFNLTLLRCAARNFSDVHDVALHAIIELDDGFCHCSPAFLQSLDFKSIAALEKNRSIRAISGARPLSAFV